MEQVSRYYHYKRLNYMGYQKLMANIPLSHNLRVNAAPSALATSEQPLYGQAFRLQQTALNGKNQASETQGFATMH